MQLPILTFDLSPTDADLMTAMIKRAKKFLIGKRMSAEQGQDRVKRFFRFCMFEGKPLNTTRNLDAARSAFVEDEKSDKEVGG